MQPSARNPLLLLQGVNPSKEIYLKPNMSSAANRHEPTKIAL